MSMTIGSRALAILLVASTARAQTPEAEALFREGKRLLKEGEIEKACDKLEASERLEPENGTELNLADCWERIGRTASAWTMFLKAAASAKRDDRAAEAKRRAAALEDKLVHLTIEVPDDAVLDDLEILRNDQVVDRALWNQPVPVDPAKYEIVARAPQHESWSATIKVKSKDKSITVPVLERARKTKPKQALVEGAPNAHRSLVLGLAIGGGSAIVIATGFALHSKSLEDRSDERCPTTACADAEGVDLNRRARTEGWIANIGWGLGVAAGVAAVVVWQLGKSNGAAVTPVVTDDGAGVVLGGRF